MLKEFYFKSLHRELLDREIAKILPQIKGNVLDAGSKNRRYDSYLFNADKIIAIDKNPTPDKNVLKADILGLPFEDASFDGVISLEVFEYILETEKALKEIYRVLKNDGLFVFSVPFLDPVHGDVDTVRYTHKGWQALLANKFYRVNINPIGGRFCAIFDFYFQKARNQYANYTKLLMLPALFLLKKYALFLDKRAADWRYPMGYLIVCSEKMVIDGNKSAK